MQYQESSEPALQLTGASEYIKTLVNDNKRIAFIFKEDFDGDGSDEILIGLDIGEGFQTVCKLLYVFYENNEWRHIWLLSTMYEDDTSLYHAYGVGIYDSVYAADTRGVGRTDLVIGFAAGNGHFVTPVVIFWDDSKQPLMWQYDETFYHGSLYLVPTEKANTYNIVVENSNASDLDIFSFAESGVHIRQATVFEWKVSTYITKACEPRGLERRAYNVCEAFLSAVWHKDYPSAYEMVLLSNFMGIDGLGDHSLNAFTLYVDENILPVMAENLKYSRLTAEIPEFTYCNFIGKKYTISLNLAEHKGKYKITSFYATASDYNSVNYDVHEQYMSPVGSDALTIPGWLVETLQGKVDRPDLISAENISISYVNMNLSYYPHLVVYADSGYSNSIFFIFEWQGNKYVPVFERKWCIRGIEIKYPHIILTVHESSGTGFAAYNYHVLRFTQDGYRQVWEGMASYYEMFPRATNFDITASLAFPQVDELMYFRVKRKFKGMDETNIIRKRNLFKVYRYNESMMVYEEMKH